MGKKLDALLGRSFKPSKLRPLVNLSLSRLAILKSQRQARWSLAQSDVVHLLGLGHHERALLRVEQVVKEQNMLDVLGMIESYCNVVIERMDLTQEEKECPKELKEAISSLIFASSRTGEFPELQEMRAVFASRFGKEFVARSVELRNNCGVNIKMIQKLLTRHPSLQTRMKVLQDIADENGMDLNLEHTTEEKLGNQKSNKIDPQTSDDVDEGLNESEGDQRRIYKDVADAAQEAFKSAANAAAAAKAAVELSRYRPPDTGHHDSRDLQRKEDRKNKEIDSLSMKSRELDVHIAKTKSHTEEVLEDDVISSTAPEENSPHLPDGKEESELKDHVTHSDKGSWTQKVQRTDAGKKPVSVRTRR